MYSYRYMPLGDYFAIFDDEEQKIPVAIIELNKSNNKYEAIYSEADDCFWFDLAYKINNLLSLIDNSEPKQNILTKMDKVIDKLNKKYLTSD